MILVHSYHYYYNTRGDDSNDDARDACVNDGMSLQTLVVTLLDEEHGTTRFVHQLGTYEQSFIDSFLSSLRTVCLCCSYLCMYVVA
jgi:hypothetical protein